MSYLTWNLNPVLLDIGGVKIHWYGVIFAIALTAGYQIIKWIYQCEGKSIKQLDSLLTYVVAGMVVGARLGHCLFYDPIYYLSNPLEILAVWKGGLASHGGGLGVMLSVYIYQKKHGGNFLWLLDRLAIPTALIGCLIRIGNFFNSEIVGLTTNLKWAVVFERIDYFPRHPVQLYESVSYLVIFMFLISLYQFSNIKHRAGAIIGVMLIMVFSVRFLLEYVKVNQAAYTSELMLTTGQLLSVPFLAIGLALIIMALMKYQRCKA